MPRLAVIILTRNESHNIVACIESAKFANFVLVFDSFSTDNTVELARSVGAQVVQHPFENYAAQRNAALSAIGKSAEWVLFVDADERVTPELAEEVREVIQMPGYATWRVPRHNYIFGKLTRATGWYPDYQTRLLKVGAAHYERAVHEIVVAQGEEGTLKEHLIHYNYTSTAQFAAKQRQYAAFDAQIMHDQGIRPKPQNYVLQPWRQFWWRFVTLKGYRDGLHGLRLSALMAWYELRKYLILRRLWKTQ